MLEPLIFPTANQLYHMNEKRDRYDMEMRPLLVLEMMKELQSEGIEPDIWKIEGMWEENDYASAVAQARSGGRANVGIIILGRGDNKKHVEEWIKSGREVEGVIGFAIGRTVFLDPLIEFKDNKISREKAVEEISSNYKYFYELFSSNNR